MQKAKPSRVTPSLFKQVKKIKECNPKISTSGLVKMIRGKVGETTINMILKCQRFNDYVSLLSKRSEVEKLKQQLAKQDRRLIEQDLKNMELTTRTLRQQEKLEHKNSIIRILAFILAVIALCYVWH